VQSGDAEHGSVNAIALEAAATQDFPVLQAGQGVLDADAGLAVDLVLGFLRNR